MSGAERWLQETKCSFPYYRDPTRALYNHVGFKRSIKKVWNTATLRFYGCESAKGTPLPEGYSDIEDDPHQMGGDFILNKDSKLMFLYQSKTPSDRPSVDEVIEALKHATQSD